jgi:hypothetical protein
MGGSGHRAWGFVFRAWLKKVLRHQTPGNGGLARRPDAAPPAGPGELFCEATNALLFFNTQGGTSMVNMDHWVQYVRAKRTIHELFNMYDFDFLSFVPQGISPQFPGVLVGPPHVRKCHQMSSKEHIQLGWVVRWVLSIPPWATPRLGGVCVSCQYLPCSFVLALRELGLRLGVKARLPLRASSRGVLPGPGALAG